MGENGKPGAALNRGTVLTCIFLAVMIVPLVFLGDYNIGVLWSTLIGISTGVVIGFTSDYFTSDNHKPVLETARVSGSGSAMNIITGFSYGLISIVPSVIGIVIATLGSYYLSEAAGMSGIYGVGIAAVGMLSISGMIVSSDAYGPIVDNARGIAEMAGMPQSVIDTADVLDSAGNTAKAITKGFSISAAALTVLALFAAYAEVVEARGITLAISLRNPVVVAGVFLGAMTPPPLQRSHNAFGNSQRFRHDRRSSPPVPRTSWNSGRNRETGLCHLCGFGCRGCAFITRAARFPGRGPATSGWLHPRP